MTHLNPNATYGPFDSALDEHGIEHRGEGPITERMDACLRAAGEQLAVMRETCASMTPREQAEAAWTPTSRLTVEELEDRIRVRRGLAPVHGPATGSRAAGNCSTPHQDSAKDGRP